MILTILSFIIYLLLLIAALNVAYILFFALVGLIGYKPQKKAAVAPKKIVVVLCAYKGDAVILESAAHALLQHYPKDKYDVVVAADSLQPSTITTLKAMPLIVIEVVFEQSTKSQSLIAVLNYLPENEYDYIVVLDIDNLMEPAFLEKVNEGMQRGFKAVQGHRVAKNLNTSFAILDAISEEINNHIFRKAQRVLGFSSALIGSGMAFTYPDFKRWMLQITAIGGFDKELEVAIIKEGNKIEYLEDALVYDEKVMKAEVFGNQRLRWISAQFVYLKKYFLTALISFFKHHQVDYLNKVTHYVLLPRLLLLGFLQIACIGSLLSPALLHNQEWVIITTLCMISLWISVPKSFYTKSTLTAFLSLPKAFMLMGMALLKLKSANKKFIHTPHEQVALNTKTKDENRD